jgi:serine/threonine protein phosphatase 1
VIGDIHGCNTAFDLLTERLQLTVDDRVVILGDAVDRGPDTHRVLERILEIRNNCEVVYILGNHEEMMLDALEGRRFNEWLGFGGEATVDSYSGNLDNIPDSHLDLLDSAVNYWEDSRHICVHANLEPGVELDDQRSSWLRWKKLSGREFPHFSGKLVICGHSGTSYSAPLVKDGWVCLDTMAYGGGILSGLELESGEIIQARENREFRRGVYLHEIA